MQSPRAAFADLDLQARYHTTGTPDPLTGFYVPALSCAVGYDRVAGYFASSAFVTAAAGMARFVTGGGSMRLIAGAQLSDNDVEALQGKVPLEEALARRLSEQLELTADAVTESRLQVIAWLVRVGLTAKSGKVTLTEPTGRLARGDGPGVTRDRRHFERLIDDVHTMCYITYHDDAAAARHWADERGYSADDTFTACLQGLVNAIPRTRTGGEFNVPEVALLNRIATTCYPDVIELPEDPVQYEDQRLDL